jgi:hypothetical protein
MEPNQNVPSEREWTEEEKEEFFSSQDAITGLPNSAMAGAPINNMPFTPSVDLFRRRVGIFVTSIVPSEQGWPIALYCPLCRTTVFVLSPWSVQPEDGGYLRINDMCGDEVHGFNHNMRLGMKGWNAPIDLKPGKLIS